MKRMCLLVVLGVGCGQDVDSNEWKFQEPSSEKIEVEPEPEIVEPTPDPQIDPEPQVEPEPEPNLPVEIAPNTSCSGRLPVAVGDEWYTYDLRSSESQYRACPLEGAESALFYSLDFQGWEFVRISIWPQDPELQVYPSLQVLVDGIARHYPQCQDEPGLLECAYFYDGLGRTNRIDVVVPRPDSLPINELESAKATLVLTHYGGCADGQSCEMIMTISGASLP